MYLASDLVCENIFLHRSISLQIDCPSLNSLFLLSIRSRAAILQADSFEPPSISLNHPVDLSAKLGAKPPTNIKNSTTTNVMTTACRRAGFATPNSVHIRCMLLICCLS